MTPAEFETALALIGWKKADFARATDTNQTTISRWMNLNNPFPTWVPAHLNLLIDLKALHDKHLTPPPRPDKTAA
jgi:hypothetical protein